MRVDERDIPGASDRPQDTSDLVELRISNRVRVSKRQWPEVETTKPRKKQCRNPLPTLSPSQNTTQNRSQTSTTSFAIYEDKPSSDTPEINVPAGEKTKQKHDWEAEYEKIKKESTAGAGDYLVRLIGNDEYPDVLRVPKVSPQVLINEEFTLKDPLSIWRQFVAEKDLLYIAEYTNKNAVEALTKQRLARPVRKTQRPWKRVTTVEIGSYFGALFLLGTLGAASLCDNWNTSEDSPVYPIRQFISLTRFQQISRYLKINELGKTNNSLEDTEFWHKVDPLVTSFRAHCKATLRPGTVSSTEEQLRRNRGRWKHALQIPSKADSTGVKIYSLCAGYYCYDFLFASKVVAVPEARKFTPKDPNAKPFTTSESVVLTLIEQIQEQHSELYLTMACDNFFITHKLFAELKSRGIAVYGTAKVGSGMPAQQVRLRDCTSKKKDYGLLCNSVYDGVNHVTFVDQKAVHMITTAHDVKNDELAWRDAATRRNACLKRSRETAGRTELPYPQLSEDYNHGMNSCDVASQLWSYYSVSRYSHWRNWWPMLWLILDASIANVLYLYRLKGFSESQLSHRDLQTTIALQLLRQPASVLRKRKSDVQVYGQRPSKIIQSPHQWIKPGKTSSGLDQRGECVQCKSPMARQGRPPVSAPLQELSTNIQRRRGPRSRFKCKECDVWLCQNSTCWQRFHLDERDWKDAGVL